MFRFAHSNFYVTDLEKSLRFYKEALGLTEGKRVEDAGYVVVYLKDEYDSHYRLELIWDPGKAPHAIDKNEYHLAFSADDMKAARAKHAAMGCICYEDDFLGIYFIMDPDGYWLAIMPDGYEQGKWDRGMVQGKVFGVG